MTLNFCERDQVSWSETDFDDDLQDIEVEQTGFIVRIEGEQALLDCDCGPRRTWKPLAWLTLVSRPSI